MSFKSKFNKYARKIATALTYFDNEGLGKNPLLDISRLLKNSRPVIFDVGANVGQSIIKYKKQFPKSFIYSFEPSPETYKTLIRTANQYESVKAINCALGSIPGKTILYENSYSDMSSLLQMGEFGSGNVMRETEVEVLTIDKFCAQDRIPKIDILKIDTQGFDLEVVRGASTMISNSQIKFIYLEIIFSDMYKKSAKFSEIYDFLIGNGFILVSLYQFHYQKGVAGWTDGLFVHSSLVHE